MRVNAYAKINLTLDFAGRREDGYHLLRMVMQSISLHDSLTLKKGDSGIRLYCRRADVPCDQSNTVYKAVALFYAFCGRIPAIDIKIEKKIPSQAGLGGGSTDAAAVLHALNQMEHTNYSLETLCKIGVQVGADVPFCLFGGTALAEGIGEKLTALAPLPHCSLVVCKPPVGVNTGKAFAKADSLGVSGNFTEPMLQAVRTGAIPAIAAALGNDFERVTELDEVTEIKQRMLASGALGACLTGSGSAVYGIFEERAAAAQCRGQLSRQHKDTFLCEPVVSGFEFLQ